MRNLLPLLCVILFIYCVLFPLRLALRCSIDLWYCAVRLWCVYVACFIVLVHRFQWASSVCELMPFVKLWNFWTWFFQILFLATPPPVLWMFSHADSETCEPGWWKLAPFSALCELQALLLWYFREILSLLLGSFLICMQCTFFMSLPHKNWTHYLPSHVCYPRTLLFCLTPITFWHSKLYSSIMKWISVSFVHALCIPSI